MLSKPWQTVLACKTVTNGSSVCRPSTGWGVSSEEDAAVVEIFITDTSKFNTSSIEKQSISLCTELAASLNVRFSSRTYIEHFQVVTIRALCCPCHECVLFWFLSFPSPSPRFCHCFRHFTTWFTGTKVQILTLHQSRERREPSILTLSIPPLLSCLSLSNLPIFLTHW